MTNNKLSKNVRQHILKISSASAEGHIGSSFSIVEQLIAIKDYWQLRGFDGDGLWSSVVLSKGHGVFALYGLMFEVGVLDEEDMAAIGQKGSRLIGHVPYWPEKRFHWGTGSLGIGLSIAVGVAYGRYVSKDPRPVFVVVGDGELNEGICWEALLIIQKLPNINLFVLIDDNNSSARALPMKDALKSLKLAWRVRNCSGHDVDNMVRSLSDFGDGAGLLWCQTQKGFPVSEMSSPVWHHRSPSADQVERFTDQISSFFGKRGCE